MTEKERHEREAGLLEEIQRIGESVRDITPAEGHLSLTWFPDGHMDVFLFAGERVKNDDGSAKSIMVLDAWADTVDGRLMVSRI